MPLDPTEPPLAADEIVSINDPRLPVEVREQALLYRDAIAWVEVLGAGEFVLFTAQGDLVDLIYLT